jgi:hypothetical protein
VALEGTKVRANAAPEANRTAATIAEQIARMLAEAEARDASEDRQSAAPYDDQPPSDLSCPNDRLARLWRLHDRLQRRAAVATASQEEKLDCGN